MTFITRGRKRNPYNILTGKPKIKGPLRRPGHKLEDNIKLDPKEIGCEVMHWIHVVQDGFISGLS
jgi:hypothetical protein